MCGDELEEGEEGGESEDDVEGYAEPGEVVAVEGWVPREVDAAEGESGSEGHVGPAAARFAVKGSVFEGHDRGAYEERYSRVVDAGVALEERLVGDAVHGVHDARAEEALAGGEEEDCGDDDVCGGARLEVDVLREEVEGEAEHEHEADEVRPNVCRLIVNAADGADAGPVAVVEAVARQDVLVGLPRLREVLIAYQAVLLCAGKGAIHGEVDLELDGLSRAVRLVQTSIDDAAGPPQLLVYGLEAGIAEGVGAGFEIGNPIFNQQYPFFDLLC